MSCCKLRIHTTAVLDSLPLRAITCLQKLPLHPSLKPFTFLLHRPRLGSLFPIIGALVLCSILLRQAASVNGEEGGRDWFIAMLCCSLSHAARAPPRAALRVQTQEPRRIRWSELQPDKRDSINFYWEIAVHFDPHANLKYWLPQYMCVQHLKSLCFNLPHHRAVFLHCNNSNFEILMSSSREVQRPLMFLI